MEVLRGRPAVHQHPGSEQRQVEARSVVADQCRFGAHPFSPGSRAFAGPGMDSGLNSPQELRFAGEVAQEPLGQFESRRVEAAGPEQEYQGSRPGGQPGGFAVDIAEVLPACPRGRAEGRMNPPVRDLQIKAPHPPPEPGSQGFPAVAGTAGRFGRG
jgi:hypothetical protein